MNRFVALKVALELVHALGALLPTIRQHDKDLASQLRRAGSSIPSCLAEGNKRVGRDRLHLFRLAGGSAAEVHTQLEIAVAWGYVSRTDIEAALALADRAGALAWRLTHPRS